MIKATVKYQQIFLPESADVKQHKELWQRLIDQESEMLEQLRKADRFITSYGRRFLTDEIEHREEFLNTARALQSQLFEG